MAEGQIEGKLPIIGTAVTAWGDAFRAVSTMPVLAGIVFAILLVYFVMVVNFQSWLDPFIILMALPGAAAGILWMLFVTGTTLSVLDDGAANQIAINSFSATRTAALGGSTTALPFFSDAGSPYTGAITSAGSQSVGLAGRLSVNPALIGDPSGAVLFALMERLSSDKCEGVKGQK